MPAGFPHSTHAIIHALADGHFHSGTRLAGELGLSRSAVWKHIHQLESFGLQIFSVPGRGYRLAEPVQLLDQMRLLSLLAPDSRERLRSLSVLDRVDSTNTWLVSQPMDFPAVCLCEWQMAGRGRRGRQWISPFAANLYMSVGWQFDELPPGFTALGMVAAISTVQALRTLGISGVAIKWPNDLLASGKKLGGILVDIQGEPSGRVRAVIGIGINVRMPAGAAQQIDQPWTDLSALTLGQTPDRNGLAAAVIDALLTALPRFADEGFAAFAEVWRTLDLAAGRAVTLHHQQQILEGVALGVDGEGALLLGTQVGTRRFVSGDLSMRIQP